MITAKIESVKTARLENGWNMHELAHHAEVTKQTIARIERGGSCTPATAKRVADAFSKPVTELFSIE
jgi:DNA-binding XRE family transcriptional regulator